MVKITRLIWLDAHCILNDLVEKERLEFSKLRSTKILIEQAIQDESRSISENSTWGIRRRFEQGKVAVNHTKFLGYDKDENG